MFWIGLVPAPNHLSRVIHQKYVYIYKQRNKVDRLGQRKEMKGGTKPAWNWAVQGNLPTLGSIILIIFKQRMYLSLIIYAYINLDGP